MKLEKTRSSLIVNKEFNLDGVGDFIYEINNPDISINDIILSEESKKKLNQIILEYNQSERLAQFNGLQPIKKIILEWDSWCGKTTTALAIANSLKKTIIIVNLTEIISSRLGETSKNLNKVINYALDHNAIIFFDEFDSISKHRTDDKELWEMKRLVNSIIQILDFQAEELLIIAATNNISQIDQAILRRFEETLHFRKPNSEEIEKYIHMIEFHFFGKVSLSKSKNFLEKFKGQDFFKIKTTIYNAIKRKILSSNKENIKISINDL